MNIRHTICGCLLLAPLLAMGAGAPTFDKDVAPIVFDHCATCHRPGQVAPFPLLNYHDVRKRDKQIARVVGQKIMPPWKAEPGFGEFSNDRHLSAQDIATIRQWVESGGAEGDATDLPPTPQFSDDWTLGKPDVVLEPARAYTLGAEGPDLYRCFVVPTHLAEDRYVTAIEVWPGNRKVVHHVIVYVDTSGKARELEAQDPGHGPGYTSFGGVGFKAEGSLGGWAPGMYPNRLPDGVGRFLPKNSDIVVQVHYHRSGKTETDQTKVALYFAKGPVDKRLRAALVAKRALYIPAGNSNFVVHASLPVKYNVTVYHVIPHMHLLGREMKVTATLPDGTLVPLVHVQNWDFNWQTSYEFKTPVHLPAGSRVDLEARYDNSTNNPLNPSDPPRLATWGEQTTDEMCLAFLHFTLDSEHLTRKGAFPRLDSWLHQNEAGTTPH